MAAALLGAFATCAHAQSTEIPAPPQQKAVVIRNVQLHSAVAGEPRIEKGWISFENGKIVALGAEPMPADAVRPDAQVIDAPGHVVTPGLWASASTLGLVETLQVDATDDTTEFGDFHAEVHAATATNPDSDLPPVARNAGILMVHAFPQGGVVSGHASAMRLDGWTAMDRTVRADAGLVVRWPMMEQVEARGDRPVLRCGGGVPARAKGRSDVGQGCAVRLACRRRGRRGTGARGRQLARADRGRGAVGGAARVPAGDRGRAWRIGCG
jgi:hypothetical protein